MRLFHGVSRCGLSIDRQSRTVPPPLPIPLAAELEKYAYDATGIWCSPYIEIARGYAGDDGEIIEIDADDSLCAPGPPGEIWLCTAFEDPPEIRRISVAESLAQASAEPGRIRRGEIE